MSTLNKRDLIAAIELIFDKMNEKGLIPPSTKDKDALINNIAENLSSCNVTLDDIKNPVFQKALCVAVLSEVVMQHQPHTELNYKKLFESRTNDTPDIIKNDIKGELSALMIALNKSLPKELQIDPNQVAKLNSELDKVADKVSKDFNSQSDQTRLAENDMAVDVSMQALMNLYGGINPHITGGLQRPVTAVVGNLAGIVDYNGDNATSMAFLDESNRFDNKADPNGIENSIRARVDSLGGEIETALAGFECTSGAPTMRIPGTNGR